MTLAEHEAAGVPLPAPVAGPVHETLPHQVLALLAQHRMATVEQMHFLLRPHSPTAGTVRNALRSLRDADLIDRATLHSQNRTRVWYLTPEGAKVTRDWPELRGRPPYPLASPTVASLRTPHTLTVLRSHLAFVADARRRGDEHGYLDWTPEVAHGLGDGERVIADAVLHYALTTPAGEQTKLRAFVEVDRATMVSERLATKLIDYSRLHTYTPTPPGRRHQHTSTPTWQRWYPVFPRLLFILTGASPAVLTRRINDLHAMATEHPAVADLTRTVPIGAATMEDLEDLGPTGHVWTRIGRDKARCSWTEL